MKKVLVIKLGTAAITLPSGLVNTKQLALICNQLASLHSRYHLLVVSSGAVGSGKAFIEKYKGTINQKKAAAAIGNPLLMATYARLLGKHSIVTAQCLCERSHFSNRKSFVQLKATITELWKSNIVPIANDNDVVNDRELRFSDNDELATLLAVAFNAKMLLIGSSVDGLLDAKGELLNQVSKIDESILALVRPEKSAGGLGGMFSKLTHTRLATSLGIDTVIFNARRPKGIEEAYQGLGGTHFIAQKSNLNARQKWLLSGSTHGALVVDAGAAAALRKRKSLLAVGILRIKTPFVKGEMIDIEDEEGQVLAMAKSRITAQEAATKQPSLIVAHANDIQLS